MYLLSATASSVAKWCPVSSAWQHDLSLLVVCATAWPISWGLIFQSTGSQWTTCVRSLQTVTLAVNWVSQVANLREGSASFDRPFSWRAACWKNRWASVVGHFCRASTGSCAGRNVERQCSQPGRLLTGALVCQALFAVTGSIRLSLSLSLFLWVRRAENGSRPDKAPVCIFLWHYWCPMRAAVWRLGCTRRHGK